MHSLYAVMIVAMIIMRSAPTGAQTGKICEDYWLKYGTQLESMPFYIQPYADKFAVFCEWGSSGLPWTIIQRRTGPELDFYRNWTEYKNGFGCPYRDYWLGNKYINQIISYNKQTRLRIELTDWSGGSCYAEYDLFKISDESDKYRLTSLGTYSGICGDSLSYHLGMQFSTFDSDNDNSWTNCASDYHGAFWYNICLHANLNGPYVVGGGPVGEGQGITWLTGKGFTYSYKSSVMKIQRIAIL